MTTPEPSAASGPAWYVPPAEALPPTQHSWSGQSSAVSPVDSHSPGPHLPAPRPADAVWQPQPVWSPGARLASPGARLGALLLDAVLIVVTLGIGWFVWSLVVWGQGTTPAKGLLRQRIVSVHTGRTVGWGQMFARQVLVAGALSWILGSLSFGLWFIVDSLTVFTDRHRRLTDRIAGTLVVQD